VPHNSGYIVHKDKHTQGKIQEKKIQEMSHSAEPAAIQQKKLRDVAMFDGLTIADGANWWGNFDQQATFFNLTPTQRIKQLEVLLPANSHAGRWMKDWLGDATNTTDGGGRLVTDEVKYDRLKRAFKQNFSLPDDQVAIMMHDVRQKPGEAARSALNRLRSLNEMRQEPVKEEALAKLFIRALDGTYRIILATKAFRNSAEALQTVEEMERMEGVNKRTNTFEQEVKISTVKTTEEMEDKQTKIEMKITQIEAMLVQMMKKNKDSEAEDKVEDRGSGRGTRGRGWGRGDGRRAGYQCFRCGNYGHFSRDCYTRKENCRPPRRDKEDDKSKKNKRNEENEENERDKEENE